MNRVLVVFSDGLLSELDSARGLVSRSAWIRQAVEDKLMKEAVAPLVPQFSIEGEPLNEYELATDHATQFAGRGGREPKPKARRKKNPITISEVRPESSPDWEPVVGILKELQGRPNRRKQLEPSEGQASVGKSGPLPARCNRGACTGTIKPNGRCIRCNQEPLKESK